MSNTKGAGDFPLQNSSRIRNSTILRTKINSYTEDQALRSWLSNFFFGTSSLKRWTGDSWELAKLQYWNGTQFKNAMLKVYNGTEWVTVQTNNI